MLVPINGLRKASLEAPGHVTKCYRLKWAESGQF